MSKDNTKGLGKVIEINESEVGEHLDRMVRSSVSVHSPTFSPA